MKRGEIYYINNFDGIGCEMNGGRPAIIVSNDRANTFSSVLEVVYLTTKEKKPLPTHVEINSTERKSTALCEQVSSVDLERIGSYFGCCTEEEMKAIDEALMVSLSIQQTAEHGAKEIRTDTIEIDRSEYASLKSQLAVYKEICDKLL